MMFEILTTLLGVWLGYILGRSRFVANNTHAHYYRNTMMDYRNMLSACGDFLLTYRDAHATELAHTVQKAIKTQMQAQAGLEAEYKLPQEGKDGTNQG
jgi:hypothetical protein